MIPIGTRRVLKEPFGYFRRRPRAAAACDCRHGSGARPRLGAEPPSSNVPVRQRGRPPALPGPVLPTPSSAGGGPTQDGGGGAPTKMAATSRLCPGAPSVRNPARPRPARSPGAVAAPPAPTARGKAEPAPPRAVGREGGGGKRGRSSVMSAPSPRPPPPQ